LGSSSTRLYRWPAEWELQSATWISWPHNRDTWPGRFAPIPSVFTQFIQELAQVQRVEVLAGPAGIQPAAYDCLAAAGLLEHAHVRIHAIPTSDVWIRDYGPTFVQRLSDGAQVGVDWRFNAWGGKYPGFEADAASAAAVLEIAGRERIASEMHCEGGGIEGDGAGTLLATSSCFVTDTRNPSWGRARIEQELRDKLGVEQIIWVDGGGLDGDDTDGHIDQLARFVQPGVVVAAVSSRPEDSNAQGLLANLQTLQEARDARGQRLVVHTLPTPAPKLVDGRRVPESYCNFLLANGIAIVPTFRSPDTDRAALRLLEQLLPDRRIVPLDAADLIWGLGAFHCASQQQPAS
jgi:agmatine deiminase